MEKNHTESHIESNSDKGTQMHATKLITTID